MPFGLGKKKGPAGAASTPSGPATSALIPGAEPAVSAALTTGALPYATVPAVPVTNGFTGFDGFNGFNGFPAVAPTVYGAAPVPGFNSSYGFNPAVGAPVGFGAPAAPVRPGVPGTDVLLNNKSREALAATPQMSSFPGAEVLPLTEVSAFGIPRGTALAGTNFAARPSLPNFNPETEAFIRYSAAAQGIHPNEFLRRVGQDPTYLNKVVHPSQRNDRSNYELLRMIAPYLSRPGIFVP